MSTRERIAYFAARHIWRRRNQPVGESDDRTWSQWFNEKFGFPLEEAGSRWPNGPPPDDAETVTRRGVAGDSHAGGPNSV